MDLDRALEQIAQIRQHMAGAHAFRGYRAATALVSSAVGLAAALAQARWLSEPMEQVERYLLLWCSAAALSLLAIALQLWARFRAGESALQRDLTRLALAQFAPAFVAGALMTVVLVHLGPRQVLWVLPGMWAIVFGLGIFATQRLLPRAITLVGAWYVASGLAALAWGQGQWALAPWTMAVSFGGGQLLAAAVLYWSQERDHGQE